MGRLQNIVNHLRKGTLIKRILGGRAGVQAVSTAPVGNVYHGECAENYLKDRTSQTYWNLENVVVGDLVEGLPAGVRVLDMPVGTGRFVPYYLKKKMEVYGLDASNDMLEVARNELGEDYDRCHMTVGDALQLPYDDDFFNLVVSFRFLSHVLSFSQAKQALKELARVANGTLLIQLRVRRDDVPAICGPAEDEAMQDKLNLLSLKEVLLEAGLKTERVVPLEEREVYNRSVFVCARV